MILDHETMLDGSQRHSCGSRIARMHHARFRYGQTTRHTAHRPNLSCQLSEWVTAARTGGAREPISEASDQLDKFVQSRAEGNHRRLMPERFRRG